MNNIQQTYINSTNSSNRADFNKNDFDRLISEKGREVIIETALQCPCKGTTTNQLSSCKNCGGTSWIYVNPRSTRMVISGVDVSTKYAPWSEEARGTAAISAMSEEELSYFDKLTIVDSNSVYGEVINITQSNSNLFAYTVYEPKDILYAGMFIDAQQPLLRLTPSQFSIEKNIFRVIDVANIPKGSQITLRYKHAPSFLLIEFKRETMQTFKFDLGGEVMQDMPISAFAKRLHYHINPSNLAKDWLVDNSFNDDPNKI